MKNNVWFRLALIVLAVSMCLSLFACGPTEEETTEAPDNQTTEKQTDEPTTEAPDTETEETKAPDTETEETKAPDTETEETKAPDTETEETKAPETETDPPEPTPDEKYLTLFIDAEEIAKRLPNGNASSINPTLSEDKTYATAHGTGAGDQYFTAFQGSGETGAFIIMKYRYSSANEKNPSATEIFLSCTNGGATGGDSFQPAVIADGQWHVVIYDMRTITTSNGFTANEDGTYSLKYLRWDIFNHVAPATDTIDVAYMGMGKTLDDVMAYAKEVGDESAYIFTESKKYAEFYTADGSKKLMNAVLNAEELSVPATAQVGGKFSKVELAEDKSYVSIYGNTTGDAFFNAYSNGTAIGKFVVFKYRYALTEETLAKAGSLEIFLSSVNGGAAGGDSIHIQPVFDGEWHTAIIDLNNFKNGNDNILDETGTCCLKYVRLDILNWHSLPEDRVDVAYFGITDSLAKALEYANATDEAADVITREVKDPKAETPEYETVYTTVLTKTGEKKILEKLLDADALLEAAATQIGGKFSNAVVEDGVLSIYGNNTGDCWFKPYAGGTTAGNFLVFNYKYTLVEGTKTGVMEMFLGNKNEGPTGNGDNFQFGGFYDGEWHTMIIDLSKFQTSQGFDADENGNIALKYFRFDIFNFNVTPEDRVDMQFAGIASSYEQALEYAAKYGTTAHLLAEKANGIVDIYTADGSIIPTEVTIPEAHAAEDGASVLVSGTVVYIDTPWNEEKSTITVTLQDAEGNQILVYKFTEKVALGDKITVVGKVGSYNGTKQITDGKIHAKNGNEDVSGLYNKVTITEAVAAADGALVKVRGTVKSVDGEWNEAYGNMNVTIEDADGNTIYVYRLRTQVKVGDDLYITGKIGSYNGAKQVGEGATAVIIVTEASTAAVHETKGDFTSCSKTANTTLEYKAEGDLFAHTLVTSTSGSDESISLPTGMSGQYIVLVFSCVNANGAAARPEFFVRTAAGVTYQNTNLASSTGWNVALFDAATFTQACIPAEDGSFPLTFVRLDHNTPANTLKVAYYGVFTDAAEAAQTAGYYQSLIALQ